MFKNTHLWIFSYLLSAIKRVCEEPSINPVHLFFCIADHFEPYWGRAHKDLALKRVRRWLEEYPEIAKRHSDSDGRGPRISLFYPEEEYDSDILSLLSEFCHSGYGELEIHLHHDGDTSEGMRKKLLKFKETLSSQYNFLSRDKISNDVRYGFIHGNWALANSRKDGKWCGVNNEIEVLSETGCYADFTLPSAPDETQTKTINSIYYAIDDPGRSKSHNTGRRFEIGKDNQEGLLMIQGPLALNWRRRKKNVIPKIENGSITGKNPVTMDRIKLWVKHAPKIAGRPDWRFVKVYTHGCQEENMDYLLAGGLDALFLNLKRNYGDGKNFVLHYVTAREMFNVLKALEEGTNHPPEELFDYRLVRNGGQSHRGADQ